MRSRIRSLATPLAFAATLCLSAYASAGATITVVNVDGPGEGFNDPSAPVIAAPGNVGATVGAQRLIAFQHAANIWGASLDSNVEILVQASFDPLSCSATGATLGAAGTIQIFANFPPDSPYPGPQFLNTWHHGALANKRAGYDLAPGPTGATEDDLVAFFNSNLGQPGCLTGTSWYYGLDANQPASSINLVTVLLHEFAHGLGFSQFASTLSGAQPLGLTDVYGRNLLDTTLNKTWDLMTNAERQFSTLNSRRVVWAGSRVGADLPNVLTLGTPLLTISAPAAIAANYSVGAAAFGPQLGSPISGSVVQALDAADGTGPTTFDACTAITNAAAIAGKIALVDRGACGFIVKVKNAQNAGAVAVIVADNVAGGPPAGLGGADPTIIIPSVRITRDDGNTIKAQLGVGVSGTLGVDLTVRAGADDQDRALMNAPNPRVPGSSISHWDPIAFRNQLMEPSINADLSHSVQPPEDLTLSEMRDVGWDPDADVDGVEDSNDDCAGSDRSATVVIGSCNSGVGNPVFTTGCSISDLVGRCAVGATNHGQYVSCVASTTNDLKKQGIISGAQKGAIQSCAAKANIP